MILKKIHKYIIALIFIITYGNSAFSQSSETIKTEVYSDTQVKVEVEFKLSNKICVDPNKSNKYTYIISGRLYSNQKYVNWKLNYTDCNGNKQIENKQVLIGGSDAVKGRIETLDQRFVGFLDNYSNNYYVETIISNIDILIKNKNYLKAKEELESKSSIIKDSIVIKNKYSNIYTNAQIFYFDSLNSLLNNDKITLASKLIKEAEILFKTLPNNLLSKKKEIELIKFEQKRVEFVKQINGLIEQNNILKALIIYNANIDSFRNQNVEIILIEKATSIADSNFISNDFEYAKLIFNELYKQTGNKKYLEEIQKCDKEIKNKEILLSIKLHKEIQNEAKQNKSLESYEKLYDLESKYDIFKTKNTTKKLKNIWVEKIDSLSKSGRKYYNLKDYQYALNDYNNSLKAVNEYIVKSYFFNYNSSITKMRSKIVNKRDKVDKIVSSSTDTKLKLMKNEYEMKRIKHKVIRLGLTYSFINGEVNKFSTYYNEASSLSDYIIKTYSGVSLSNISAFLTYNRIGFFAGNFYTSSSIKNCNLGMQIRMIGHLYAKVGYSLKSDEIFTINNFANNYITGISFIGNGLNLETTYNHRFNTIQIGVGFNIYKRFNKNRYIYLKELLR